MANLGSYEQTEIPLLVEYAKDVDVSGDISILKRVIETESGLFLVFFEGEYNHFVFSGKAVTEKVKTYVEEAAKTFKGVDALLMKCESSDGRKVSFLTENKHQIQVESKFTSSGNKMYTMLLGDLKAARSLVVKK